LGKPLLTQPAALAVITQAPERFAAPAPKNEHSPTERIDLELLPAQRHQPVYSLAVIPSSE